MAFEETQFPVAISYGSAGGPGFLTRKVESLSGFEDRDAKWSEARRAFDIAYGIKPQIELEDLLVWHQAMKGSHVGFRARDADDYKSCLIQDTPAQTDQILLASAVGGETTTQIIKTYPKGGQSTTYTVTKPVNGTVLVERNTGLLIEGTDYVIDYTTGIITWDTGVFPSGLTASDTIKAGYEYDVPVRFVNDRLSIVREDYYLGSASVPLVEIRV